MYNMIGGQKINSDCIRINSKASDQQVRSIIVFETVCFLIAWS